MKWLAPSRHATRCCCSIQVLSPARSVHIGLNLQFQSVASCTWCCCNVC
jgi:hypothetical protein